MCHTPMLSSNGAKMGSSFSSQCEENYVTFRGRYGQCFASGIQSASQFTLVVKQDSSSLDEQASNEAKLKGALPSEVPGNSSDTKGAANITSSFAAALSGMTHT